VEKEGKEKEKERHPKLVESRVVKQVLLKFAERRLNSAAELLGYRSNIVKV
jgi:hypothetical protein